MLSGAQQQRLLYGLCCVVTQKEPMCTLMCGATAQVIFVVEQVMRIRNAALFIDNFQTTNLLAANPVDNT